MTTPTTLWKRLTRRLGHDGNPLRRRSDLVDAWLLPVAVVVFLGLCPLVVGVTGSWMRAANISEQHAQVGRHPVPGVLLRSVPGPMQASHGVNTWVTWAPARWTVDGVRHTGDVPAEAGSRAGSPVTVWLDHAGRVQAPPLSSGQAGSRILEARVAGVGVLAALVALSIMLVRRFLDRRRLADWEHAWLMVGPSWSRRR